MIRVEKADGTHEVFKVEKLERSLRRSGASKSETSDIVNHVLAEMHDGIKTQEIYRHAFKLLREVELPTAARYSVRRALFNLGPTGFPFEDFLSRLFATEGYTTGTRAVLNGKCVQHEIDVTAYKKEHSFVAEAKFHSRPGIKSDLQVALYSYARFLDLRDAKICHKDICGITELWLITNTKFTSTAQQYSECVGLNLLSWDYPKKNNLHDRIQKSRLYPVTVLQAISAGQKQILISKNIIICSDILDKPQVLRHLHISTKKIEAVLSEARQLCSSE
ncbi:MAG: hypothetical protein ACI9VM_000733 [Candidatus Azotimanducaceae bacterium]|jgi:hypothetical protein